ncbi:ATP-binding cassette subfamily B protein [Anaerobacterium chartisolvens]|uniref:ATP-binding cassette subfamily B protein n=1 Tax=Anaerobacterium chartisolvens TaxID=1297424 RepID=A0A369BEC9_9FIRM|nr:ABC transporter ATP-binding protein [Anaerobacterium chartisolvens]RCX18837.1 ATP-binding cassette subfamily B protein [Anaerobacterium chartisolvens]
MKNDISLLSAKDMRRSILAALITAASVICGIIPFFNLLSILEMLASRQPFDRIAVQCIIIAALLIAKSVFYGLGIAVSHRVAFSTLIDIRKRIISHMERLSLSDIAGQKSGSFAQVVDNEVEQVEVFIAHALPELLVASIIPVAVLAFMYTVCWQFALILTIQIPVLIVFMMLFMKRYSSKFEELTQRTGKMTADLLEYIEGIRVIKVFNTGRGKTNEILQRMKDYISWVKKVSTVMTFSKFIQSCIISSGVFLTAAIGTGFLIEGSIEYKDFVISIIFAGFFGESLGKLLTYTFKVMKFNSSRKAILSVLSIPVRDRSEKAAKAMPGDIEFSGVSFAYADSAAVSDISLTARSNASTALVGASGSGKTTIGKLINGFLLPDSGKVSIDGVPTCNISEASIAELVSYVQQDAFMFNTSIYENILIGNPEAKRDKVYDAAKKAQIHNFIMSLPDRYDTQAGEGGCRLSGGEKQRISLARMILKNAPVIVLDEATAAIDAQNEQAVHRAIEAVSKGKTTITITHRMNTISDADNIIVVENGRIADQGGHRELISRCDLYKRLMDAQYAVENWTVKEEEVC